MPARQSLAAGDALCALSALSALGALLALSACAVGPNYHRPAAPADPAFKEDHGWKPATPGVIQADKPW